MAETYNDPVAGAAREALNSSGLDTTEIALLNGVTAGTVTASKALVVSADKDIASLRHVTLTGNLVSGATTLAEGDLALVDGITAGTVLASKAVTVDANKDVGTIRHLTINGNLVTGSTTLSEAELGVLDGATAGAAVASKALVADANVKLSGVRVVTAAKTTAYPIVAADSGKVLTNFGAGASVTFTLPTVAAGVTGVIVTICAVVAAQPIVIASQTASQLVVFNNAAASSVTVDTGSEIIGASFTCVCDGTSWIVMPHLWEGQTITIA